MIQLPDYQDKRQLIDWLIANKSALVAQKKSAIKQADSISYYPQLVNEKGEANKAAVSLSEGANKIKVRSVINTTKFYDSHGDVHIDQLWNKSLKESKDFYLVNQHNFSFEGIISDNVKAFAKQIDWTDLGYTYEGQTQALIFDSVIDKNESPEMFNRYAQGKVKNHSVGMQYVKMDLAVNDDRYEKEFALWNKYAPQIANKEAAVENGFFWAVTEAKIIEGSAVVRGSNSATPTQSIIETKSDEPTTVTHNEPGNHSEVNDEFQKRVLNLLITLK
jgi:hypothetical protein